MKKIAFVLRFFQGSNFHGGGEKIFYKLIEKLINKGFIIDLYCSESNVIDFPGINNIVILNKPYIHTNPTIIENFYDEVKRLISDKDYDFIISENITPPIDITFIQGHSMAHRRRKLRSPLSSLVYNLRPVKLKRIRYEEKWLMQGYRKIYVLSNILKNDLINNFGVSEEKITIIDPVVDITIPEPTIKPFHKEFTFGLSAPGFERKGGYIFLKALAVLKKRNIKFKAKIIYPKFNKNLWVKTLIKLYNLQDSVDFLSFQSNMQDFYDSIDCLVMPSIEETFGLVALEAMINKKLSVVSSYSGASEIIQDKINGFVFDMNKPAENLANKMEFIINNQNNLENCIKNGYETAKNYSWDRFSSKFIEELLKLC